MELSTAGLTLTPDAPIDLQTHTSFSDGRWTAEFLIDYLAREGFALAAITDHDRADTAPILQSLAMAKRMPLLVAVEMTTLWQGEMTDILCYGFDADNNLLAPLGAEVLRRQQENSRQTFDYLRTQGCEFTPEQINTLLEKPSAQHLMALVDLVKAAGYGTPEVPAGKLVMDGGARFAMVDPADVVDAAHRSGAVCIVAHPGRGGEHTVFNEAWFDDLRRTIPVDGLEAYYATHTPEQTAFYLEYARKHNLYVSAGSDSHGPEQRYPIKYRAEQCRALLERLGVTIS